MSDETACADFLVRTLLRGGIPNARENWHELRRIAAGNVILVRIDDALRRAGLSADQAFINAAAVERTRITKTVSLIGVLAETCKSARIPYVFTKAFQHWPDMGHDVDLFVGTQDRRIDSLLHSKIGAQTQSSTGLNKFAGKTVLRVPGHKTPIEVHHGRLGHLGEDTELAKAILGRVAQWEIGAVHIPVPAPEEALVLQVMQRMYGHFTIRISDVIRTLELLSVKDLDWGRVDSLAKRSGISEGLTRYLYYVNSIVTPILERSILPPAESRWLAATTVDPLRFHGGVYRYRRTSVSLHLYAARLKSLVAHRDWAGAGRLSLMSPVAAGHGMRALTRRLSRR